MITMDEGAIATLEDRLEAARHDIAPIFNRFYSGEREVFESLDSSVFPSDLKKALIHVSIWHEDGNIRYNDRRNISHPYSLVLLAHEVLPPGEVKVLVKAEFSTGVRAPVG